MVLTISLRIKRGCNESEQDFLIRAFKEYEREGFASFRSPYTYCGDLNDLEYKVVSRVFRKGQTTPLWRLFFPSEGCYYIARPEELFVSEQLV